MRDFKTGYWMRVDFIDMDVVIGLVRSAELFGGPVGTIECVNGDVASPPVVFRADAVHKMQAVSNEKRDQLLLTMLRSSGGVKPDAKAKPDESQLSVFPHPDDDDELPPTGITRVTD